MLLNEAMKKNPRSFGEHGENEKTWPQCQGHTNISHLLLSKQIPEAAKIPFLFCYFIKSLKICGILLQTTRSMYQS